MATAPPAGSRVAVRHRLPDGSATDVVGVVIARDPQGLRVLPDDRAPVDIAAETIIAIRAIPPRAVRPGSSRDDLQRLMSAGWPGLAQRRLGGWLLRAGAGATHRANSTLVVGDPGCSVEAAIGDVVAWSAEHGIRPSLQVPKRAFDEPSDVDRWADEQGWGTEYSAIVMVRDLRDPAATRHSPSSDEPASQRVATGEGDDLTLTVEQTPSADWCALVGATEAAVREQTAVPAAYLSLRDGEALVAVARAVRTQDWVGLASVAVAQDRRGQGLGRRLCEGVVAWALGDGARFGYLQVEPDNAAALALYRSTGWREHHVYHYRVAPSGNPTPGHC